MVYAQDIVPICTEAKKCIKCRKKYGLLGFKENNQNLICLPEDLLAFGYYEEHGYYKNEENSIYYKCLENCNFCSNSLSCEECKDNYRLVGNRENDKIICLSENELTIGYYKNNSIYYKCINNCNICSNSISCIECKDNYTLVKNKENDNLICLLETEINKGYYENNSIYYRCIDFCYFCSNSISCQICEENYTLVGNKNDDNLICLSENETSVGYYKDNNSIFYECIKYCEICSNDIYCNKCRNKFDYNNNTNECIGRIENCEEYYYNGSCHYCKENYTFVGNKETIKNNKIKKYFLCLKNLEKKILSLIK